MTLPSWQPQTLLAPDTKVPQLSVQEWKLLFLWLALVLALFMWVTASAALKEF